MNERDNQMRRRRCSAKAPAALWPLDRRALVRILAVGVLGSPFTGGAQQHEKVARVGVLSGASGTEHVYRLLPTALREFGYVEGRNLELKWRWAEGRAERRLPAIYTGWGAAIVEAGGLMSYGPNLDEMYRRTALFIDKMLKGARPADLPVEQPRKFDFLVNLKTAKALGRTIAPSALMRADRLVQ